VPIWARTISSGWRIPTAGSDPRDMHSRQAPAACLAVRHANRPTPRPAFPPPIQSPSLLGRRAGNPGSDGPATGSHPRPANARRATALPWLPSRPRWAARANPAELTSGFQSVPATAWVAGNTSTVRGSYRLRAAFYVASLLVERWVAQTASTFVRRSAKTAASI